jgi:hypothetical protein
VLAFREARSFHGIFRPVGLREGVRIEGTADETSAALRDIGFDVIYEPVESGPPGDRYLGVLRTLGSPWVEVTEPVGLTMMSDGLLQDLSRRMGRRTFQFRYAFDQQQFRHRLFANGQDLEELETPLSGQAGSLAFRSDRPGGPSRSEVAADLPNYLQCLFRALKMRDWGLGVAELASLTIPFPPTLLVECYFFRITRF